MPRRLSSQLVISHSAPVVAVTLALALTLTTLGQLSMLLTDLTETELVLLREEDTLHRMAWEVDLTLRRAESTCLAQPRSGAAVLAPIAEPTRRLQSVVSTSKPGPTKELALGYLNAVQALDAGDPCAALLGAQLKLRRAALDEQLTQHWVDRLEELHAAVTVKDEQARQIAVSATSVGIPLAVASLLLSLLIARRMSSIVNRPLAHLAVMADQLGNGDLDSPVRASGPFEVVLLAGALERMRVQLKKVATLKESFLASVSHELRTPLSKIREALTLIEDGAVGECGVRMTRVIGIARTACENEIRMVTTLLDVSRLRAGSPVRKTTEGSSLDAVLQSALRDELVEATSRGVTLALSTRGPQPVCLLDPLLLERAVANLVRNAVAVSQRGQCVHVEHALELDAPEHPGTWVAITVSDQGPGVPNEIRDTLFDPFVTSAVPSTSKGLGVGLGLALVREVAQAHEGTLELVHTGRTGAAFRIWIPVQGTAPHLRAEAGKDAHEHPFPAPLTGGAPLST